jgi:dephospho-CoA kinase
MKIVGITGGIGSGKSVVCSIFSLLGIPVFNTDEISKKLVNSSHTIRNQLIENFGNEIYKANLINKEMMAALIFNDLKNLKIVNQIIHPEVIRSFSKWKELYNDKAFVIIESAIIFENNLESMADMIILTYADENVRIERILKRDKTTKAAIKKIFKNQLSDEIKMKRADKIIYNNSNDMLIPQVLTIFNELN